MVLNLKRNTQKNNPVVMRMGLARDNGLAVVYSLMSQFLLSPITTLLYFASM